jgi:hypothetical protein
LATRKENGMRIACTPLQKSAPILPGPRNLVAAAVTAHSGLLPAPELQLHQRLLLLHLPCSACRLPPLSICCSCYATDASKQLSDTQLPARTGGLRMYSSNCQWLGL